MDLIASLGPCLQAVLQVLSIVLLGMLLSWRGLLPPQFVKTLAALLFDVLLPCILFTSVVRTITWEKVIESWIYPLWVLIVVSMGFLISLGASAAIGLSDSQRRMVVLTAAFPNSGYLPLLLLPAMCRLHPAFAEDPGAADRSVGYVSVYVCFLSVALWVVATMWMSRPAKESTANEDKSALDGSQEQEMEPMRATQTHGDPENPAEKGENASKMYRVVSLTSMKLGEHTRVGQPQSNLRRALQEANLVRSGSHLRADRELTEHDSGVHSKEQASGSIELHGTRQSAYSLAPDAGPGRSCSLEDDGETIRLAAVRLEQSEQQKSVVTSILDGCEEADHYSDSALLTLEADGATPSGNNTPEIAGGSPDAPAAPSDHQQERRPVFGTLKHWLMAVWHHPVVTNPLLASLSGLALGVIPPIKGVLVTPNAPLNWMFEAGVLIGRSATPLAMMIMGAQLHGSLQAARAARGTRSRGHSVKKLLGSVASSVTRLILVPLGASLAALALHGSAGAFGSDPLLMVTLLTEASTPGALNLIIIAMRQGHDSHAMAEMLMWHYAASVFTLTVVLSVVMEVVYGSSSNL